MSTPGPGEVLARRFERPGQAQELAIWCRGTVELLEQPGGGLEPRLWVPTSRGPALAVVGMWVLRRADGTHAVQSAQDFAARHEPA